MRRKQLADFSSLSPLLPGLLGSGAVGYVVGWGFKKIFKIILTIVGVIAALVIGVIYWLESKSVITIKVDFNRLNAVLHGVSIAAASHTLAVTSFTSQLNVGFVGFTGGALLGWKRA